MESLIFKLLHHPDFSYQEKYKIADAVNLLSYLPPENDCGLLDLPQEIIHLLCHYIGNSIWIFKRICQYLMKMVNQYQSMIKELRFNMHQYSLSIREICSYIPTQKDEGIPNAMNTYYSGVTKLIIKSKDSAQEVFFRELLQWKNIKTIELLGWSSENWWHFSENDSKGDNVWIQSTLCEAETLIFKEYHHPINYRINRIEFPNLRHLIIKSLCICWSSCEPNKKDYNGIYRIFEKSDQLKSFSINLIIKNKEEMQEFMKFIDETRKIKYVIESEKIDSQNYYNAQIEGIIAQQ